MMKIKKVDILNDTPKLLEEIEEMNIEITAKEKIIRNIQKNIQEYTAQQKKSFELLDSLTVDLLSLSNDSLTSIGIEEKKEVTNEIENFLKILMEMEAFKQGLNKQLVECMSFEKELEEIKDIKEVREEYTKLNNSYLQTLNKSLNRKQSILADNMENDKDLEESRAKYNKTKLEYVRKMTLFCNKPEFIENIISMTCLFKNYFNQGNVLYEDQTKNINNISSLLTQQFKKDSGLNIKLEDFNKDEDLGDDYSSFEGDYLNLRNNNNIIMFESWNRYYFKLEENKLQYYCNKKWNVLVEMKLCNVKHRQKNIDRRFVFEITSNKTTYLLQATSLQRLKIWIKLLNSNIEEALNHSNKNTNDSAVVKALTSVEGNEGCADCLVASPTWASINLGCLLCIDCSGIHRKLGVQTTKIRSLTLDYWSDSLVELLHQLGNNNVNDIFEAKLTTKTKNREAIKEIFKHSNREEREKWITSKYVEKTFCEFDCALNTNVCFIEAVKNNDIKKALKCLVQGCDVDYKHKNDMAALHVLVEQANMSGIELLSQWNADFNIKNKRNETPLHLAAHKNDVKLVWLLLKKGANPNLKDIDDMLPVNISERLEHVTIVMALRYFSTFISSNNNTKNFDQIELDFYQDINN